MDLNNLYFESTDTKVILWYYNAITDENIGLPLYSDKEVYSYTKGIQIIKDYIERGKTFSGLIRLVT